MVYVETALSLAFECVTPWINQVIPHFDIMNFLVTDTAFIPVTTHRTEPQMDFHLVMFETIIKLTGHKIMSLVIKPVFPTKVFYYLETKTTSMD